VPVSLGDEAEGAFGTRYVTRAWSKGTRKGPSAGLNALRAEVIDPKIAEHRGRIAFGIGIHQGDIVAEDGDIFGDGVKVAARLSAAPRLAW